MKNVSTLLYAIVKELNPFRIVAGRPHPRAIRRPQPEKDGDLVGVPGIEPGTSSLSGTRSNQLSYTPSPPRQPPVFSQWWRQPGSNRRHPACKAGALPTELCPRGTSLSTRAQALFGPLYAVRKGCGRHITCTRRIDVWGVAAPTAHEGRFTIAGTLRCGCSLERR